MYREPTLDGKQDHPADYVAYATHGIALDPNVTYSGDLQIQSSLDNWQQVDTIDNFSGDNSEIWIH